MIRLRVGRDPWWDLEGEGAKRTRRRIRVIGLIALAMAITACGLTTAAWVREFAPVVQGLGLG